MYDYNTFHNTDEAGMVSHGVGDMFRVPKYSFYWHQAALTAKLMAYVVRVDATRAAVFSNSEQPRLWRDCGDGYQLVATQKPDTFFTAPHGKPIDLALRHPPFTLSVTAAAQRLRAEGLVGGQAAATYEWRQSCIPVALTLEADRPAAIADGSDLSRIIVTAVDTNGTPVDTCSAAVVFSIHGLRQLIGESPVKLRAGKMIILAQSGFVADELAISAAAEGLQPAHVKVHMQRAPGSVDVPAGLPVQRPSMRTLVLARSRIPGVATPITSNPRASLAEHF